MKGNWKQISLVLIAGLIIGGAIGRLSVRGWPGRFSDPEKRFERKLDFFSKKLNLSPDQREAVRSLFEAKHEKINLLREEVGPRFQAIRENTVSEIRAILNEDQIQAFEKLEEKRNARWEKRKGPHRHGGW